MDRFAASPGIQNFCESLGRVDRPNNPAWAGKYERHVRAILAANPDRLVQCMALSAAATIAKNGGAARQGEAETLYESFIKQFGDGSNPGTKDIEAMMVRAATRELTQLRERRTKKNREPQPPGAKP